MNGAARSRDAILEHVVRALARIAEPSAGAITGTTELYYDLGLAGDDLLEAIEAVREPFGTDFSQLDVRRYAPNEVGHNFGLNLVRGVREWRGVRTYRSLTIGSLVDAVQAGSWKDG